MLPIFKELQWKMKKPIKNIYSFNVITQILTDKIISNTTIKVSYDSRIYHPTILISSPEGNYEPLYVCDQSVIKLEEKKIIGFCNTSHVDSRDRYQIEITNKATNITRDKLLVSNIMNNLTIHKYFHLRKLV